MVTVVGPSTATFGPSGSPAVSTDDVHVPPEATTGGVRVPTLNPVPLPGPENCSCVPWLAMLTSVRSTVEIASDRGAGQLVARAGLSTVVVPPAPANDAVAVVPAGDGVNVAAQLPGEVVVAAVVASPSETVSEVRGSGARPVTVVNSRPGSGVMPEIATSATVMLAPP